MKDVPDNLVTMADLRNDGKLLSPEVMLRECLQDVVHEKMAIKPNKALFLFLDDSQPGHYHFRFRQCGMSTSEMVALLTIARQRFLNMMEPVGGARG